MALPTQLVLILSIGIPIYLVLFVIAMFVMWRIYIVVGRKRFDQQDTDAHGLTEKFPVDQFMTIPHQKDVSLYHEIFERSARRFPDTCAVRFAGERNVEIPVQDGNDTDEELGLSGLRCHRSASYSTLNHLANQISDVLLMGSYGVHPAPHVTSPDQIVAVLLPRVSVHIFAAQLGALKAGAGVLMLDANLPESVLEFQIADSKPVALLTLDSYITNRAQKLSMGTKELTDKLLAGCGATAIDVSAVFENVQANRQQASMNQGNKKKVIEQLGPDNLAMVIYTSGTSGKPKAVLVEHKSYVNYTLDYCNYMSFVPNYDTHAQMASLSFDASLEELYGAWCAGIPLVVFTDAQIRSGPDLVPLLCDEGVTTVTLVPSLLSTISRHPERDFPSPLLRYITVGGEAITESLVEPWTRGRRELINSYGPTEATIVLSRKSLHKGEAVTIGTPVANMTLFCIDHEALEIDPKSPLQVFCHGVAGELCCSGIQVARGYLNRDELTAEKFVDISRTSYGRTYRTGDLCMIDKDTKNIVYQGRIDQQVKVRGNRIELGAVENAMLDDLSSLLDEVDQAADGTATIPRDDPIAAKQGDLLVGFLCVPNHFVGEMAELECASQDLQTRCKLALAKALPSYAVPSMFVLVPRLPRQIASGKVNRKGLPDVQAQLVDAFSTQVANAEASPETISDSTHGALQVHPVMKNLACQQCLSACQELIPNFTEVSDFMAIADSIMIARLVGVLRDFIPGVNVRDIIHFRTLQAVILAKMPGSSEENADTTGHGEEKGHGKGCSEQQAQVPLRSNSFVMHPYSFSLFQFFFIFVWSLINFLVSMVEIVVLMDLWLYFENAVLPDAIRGDIALTFVLLMPVMAVVFISLGTLFKLVIAIPMYRLIVVSGVGRCCMKIQVGTKYPKWSCVHLYLWLRLFCERNIRSDVILSKGDDIRSFTWRCLGATIGKDVAYGESVDSAHLISEYFSAGDGVILGTEAVLSTCKLSQNYILVAPLVLKNRVSVGARSYIGPGAQIETGCVVDHLTSIDDFQHVNVENEIISGVPGAPTGIAVASPESLNFSPCRPLAERPIPKLFNDLLRMLFIAIGLAILDMVVIGVLKATWPFESYTDFEIFFRAYEVHVASSQPDTVVHTFFNRTSGKRETFGTIVQTTPSSLEIMRSPVEVVFMHWLPMAVYGGFAYTITWSILIFLVAFAVLRNPYLRVNVGTYPKRSLLGGLARAKMQLFNLLQEDMFGYNSKGYMMKASGCTFEVSCGCSELASCHGLLPDTTVIGANSFWADDCVSTMVDFYGSNVKVQRSRFPQNFFMGNSAVIEPASHPTNYLVGTATVAYAHAARRQMQSRLDKSVTIFGNPPVTISSERGTRFTIDQNAIGTLRAVARPNELEKGGCSEQQASGLETSGRMQEATYTGKLAFEPTFVQFLVRGWLFDGSMKFAKFFPTAMLFSIFAHWLVNDFAPVYDDVNAGLGPSWFGQTASSSATFFVATKELFKFGEFSRQVFDNHLRLTGFVLVWVAAVLLLFIILKWLLVCRVKSGKHSLFSTKVQRHFFMWMLSEDWVQPFLTTFNGTLFASVYYSLLGAKVGWRTLMLGHPRLYGDLDQWVIGDDCVVDGYVWQSHTFEDRVFWVEKTVIGDRCYVGNHSTLMGGSVLGSDCELSPVSCAWKMMSLLPGAKDSVTKYQGSPAVQYAWDELGGLGVMPRKYGVATAA